LVRFFEIDLVVRFVPVGKTLTPSVIVIPFFRAGTFGSLIGIPEIQVGLALFLGLISIVLHLAGRPFGNPSGKSKTLHFLEMYSLVVVWCTNWCGLMLYALDGEELPGTFLSLFVIIAVTSYVIVSVYIFVTSFVKKRRERLSMLVVGNNGGSLVKVVPEKTLMEVKEWK